MIKYKPVRTITWQGKLLVSVVRFFLFFISIFKYKQWQYPNKNFEENPRYFKLRDSLYLAYKYYYTTLLKADKGAGIEAYFHAQRFNTCPTDSALTISLGGDLIPYTYINDKTCKHLWDECGPYFFSSDIVFANLETPIDTTQKLSLVPEVMLKGMLFNANEEIFNIFNGQAKYKGFDVVSVANNHALDQGEDGLLQTMRYLKDKKISYCGGTVTKNDSDIIPIIEKKNIRTAFLAFTFSLNDFNLPPEKEWMCNHIRLNKPDVDISRIVEQASAARASGAHIIIASLHMGNAYQAFPSKHIMDTIHRISAEAGIDVIVAGHAHNPQPIEWFEYNRHGVKMKTLIFYSLGDFVAYDIYTLTHVSLLVKLHVVKEGTTVSVSGLEILPTYLKPSYENGEINSLTFKHLESVEINSSTTFNDRKSLQLIQHFYNNILFTKDQRKKIIRSVAKHSSP